MLLAHGTTELNADKIEEMGNFAQKTWFLKLRPDPKGAIFGTAGFAFRGHPRTPNFIGAYCAQDLLIGLFKRAMDGEASKYMRRKADDTSPGLIYIVEASADSLGYKGGLRSLFIPTEVFSTEEIPTSAVRRIVTLEEYAAHFSAKYDYPIDTIDEMRPDPLVERIEKTLRTRWERLVLRMA